jgi:hypothetical protein
MKLDFWLELHKSLLNLIQDEITKEEMTIFNHIESTINVRLILIFKKFNEILSSENFRDINNLTIDEMEIVKQKIFSINKEKVELVCQSIKISIKLMTRIVESIENSKSNSIEVLKKIKLILKITRIVLEKSKECMLTYKLDAQNKFFTMIYVFTEKIQARLVNSSTEIIKTLHPPKPNIVDQSEESTTFSI